MSWKFVKVLGLPNVKEVIYHLPASNNWIVIYIGSLSSEFSCNNDNRPCCQSQRVERPYIVCQTNKAGDE